MKYDYTQKDLNLAQANRYMLAKTVSMFEWENLPETIPTVEIERLLQISGYAFITKVDGELYAFNGGLGGVPDVYGNPTEIVVSNPALKFNKTLSIADDGVLISNDDFRIGLIPMFNKYNTMLIENDINMMLHGYTTRMQTMISAPDDKTRESAQTYIKKVINGEISIVADNAMFDGVKLQSVHSSQGASVTQLTEYHQYMKASLYNEIGLSSNFNMKRERLVSGEVQQNEDSLFPYVYNMLKCRLDAVERLNAMFGTSIDVDFGSVWNIKKRELVDGVIGDVNEPLNEPLTISDEPLQDTPNETTKEETNDEPIPMDRNSIDNSKGGLETDKEKTIVELMEMLLDETLSDDDVNAIEQLIAEIEDKQND